MLLALFIPIMVMVVPGYSGIATFYGGNPSGGACGYATVPTSSFPFGYYAAAGGSVFNNGYGCGKCFQITCLGPNGNNPSCYCSSSTPSVTISVMDQCPECADDHFDLDPTAMARIVGPGLSGTCGIINVNINRVSCDYTNNIVIRSKSGTSAYWYGLFIDNIGGNGAVSAVALKSSGSSSYNTNCDKSNGPSFWVCNGGYPLVAPVSVRLTDDAGNVIYGNNIITNFNGDSSFNFGTNFNGGSSPTTTTTKSPTTKTPTAGSSPTTTTTKSPTAASPTTKAPTSSSGSGSVVQIRNKDGTQTWWLGFEIASIDCGTSVSSAWVKDSVNYQSWTAATKNVYGDYYFFSVNNNGQPFTTPISIKLTNNAGTTITLNNVITNFNANQVFNGAAGFCAGNSGSGANVADVNGADNNSGVNLTQNVYQYNAGTWIVFLLLIIIGLLVAIIVVYLIYKLYRRIQKNKLKDQKNVQTADQISNNNNNNTNVDDGNQLTGTQMSGHAVQKEDSESYNEKI